VDHTTETIPIVVLNVFLHTVTEHPFQLVDNQRLLHDAITMLYHHGGQNPVVRLLFLLAAATIATAAATTGVAQVRLK
jgi:hypothetical protein